MQKPARRPNSPHFSSGPCAKRPEPIPFFGELGSVNPMFLLPQAMAARGEAIAKGWVGSLTMGAGQFCTNPGIVVVIAGDTADAFARAAEQALSAVAPQTMLTEGIADVDRSDLPTADPGGGQGALDDLGGEAVDADTLASEIAGEVALVPAQDPDP